MGNTDKIQGILTQSNRTGVYVYYTGIDLIDKTRTKRTRAPRLSSQEETGKSYIPTLRIRYRRAEFNEMHRSLQ